MSNGEESKRDDQLKMFDWAIAKIEQYDGFVVTRILGRNLEPGKHGPIEEDDADKLIESAKDKSIKNIFNIEALDVAGQEWNLINIWIHQGRIANIACAIPEVMEIAVMMFGEKAIYYDSLDGAIEAVTSNG